MAFGWWRRCSICFGVKQSIDFAICFGVNFAVGFRVDFAIDFTVNLSVDFAISFGVGFSVNVAVSFDFDESVDFAVNVTVDKSVDFAVNVAVIVTVSNVMSDLTIIYLTCNKMPSRWEQFHREHLLRAVEDRPMIVISAKPMDLCRANTEYLIQTGPFCAWNVYRQILRGARLAKTKFLGIAEDDTLYPAKHFTDFRPPDDAVAYDMSRWSVFSWLGEKAFFSAIRKHGNFMMIGPTKLVIDALEEREAKYPQGKGNEYAGEIGRPDVERRLGVTRRKLVEWHCTAASINLCHDRGLSPTYVNTPKLERKPGEMKSLECPIWGRASRIAAIYNEGRAEELGARE